MGLLASVNYDPAGAATDATSALSAMAAFDTTNLRLVFTAPPNGTVLVKIRCAQKGATTSPQVLLGVMDGATVKGRVAPLCGRLALGANTNLLTREARFLVTGLTPGTSYTYDAAWGTEFAVASSTINWGGPNNTTANDASGAFTFEIWETNNLLAGMCYDPGSAASHATTAATAMAAMDTTNLRLTFTTKGGGPGSTKVLVRLQTIDNGATTASMYLLGVLGNLAGGTGTNVLIRQPVIGGLSNIGGAAATDFNVREMVGTITGLTPNTSYSFDAAWGTEGIVALTAIRYGGPNNTTQNDAWGGVPFEVWAV